MSVEAMAYVVGLTQCADGAQLTRGHKLLLLLLSNHHSTHRRIAYPSVPLLAVESLCSIAQIKRDLAFLEEHKTVWAIAGRGRGLCSVYGFYALDGSPGPVDRAAGPGEKGTPASPLVPQEKGSYATPFFEEKGSKRVHPEREKGSKRVHFDDRNKEEHRTKSNKEQKHTWASIHKSLREKIQRELDVIAVTQIGRNTYGWSPEEHANEAGRLFMLACERAQIWPHVAEALAKEEMDNALRYAREQAGASE